MKNHLLYYAVIVLDQLTALFRLANMIKLKLKTIGFKTTISTIPSLEGGYQFKFKQKLP